MKILVAVKRVVDFNAKIRVKPDGSGVDTTNTKMSMNPFDEIAIEEAIRLKESNLAKEVVVVTIGSDADQDVLRTALAMGVDRAILVQTNQSFEPLNIAKILVEIVKQENPQMLLLGKQAIDNDCNQVGQMLAGLLNWSQATFASKIEIKDGRVNVKREVDEGLETIEVKLPTVITTDLRLNVPRYISLPNIMKAKAKKIEVKVLEEMGMALNRRVTVLKTEPPAQRAAGVLLNNFEEMIAKIEKIIEV